MRFVPLALATAALATTVVTGAAFADSHASKNPAVVARQSHMQLYAHNLGPLAQMARGQMEYDAAVAQAAASNLAALAKLDQSRYWAPGTDSDTLVESRALPALWDNIPDAIAKGQQLSQAADTLAAAAGTGVDGIRANLGAVGQVCGACHESYQLSDN